MVKRSNDCRACDSRNIGTQLAYVALVALSLSACAMQDMEAEEARVASHEEPLELPESIPLRIAPLQYVPAPKPTATDFRGRERDRVLVKFVEGSHVRLRAGGLDIDLTGVPGSVQADEVGRLSRSGLDRASARAALADIQAILGSFRGLTVTKSFKQRDDALDALKAEGEANAGIELADLNLSYDLHVFEADAPALIAALNASDLVEIAYPAPIFFNSAQDIAPTTASYVTTQSYLTSSGIDARFAWTRTGGTGANVRVLDVEESWNIGHEDLGAGGTNGPSATVRFNGCFTNAALPNCPAGAPCHGTAVLGVLHGTNNGFGVTGIAHAAQYGISGIFETSACTNASVAEAIMQAASAPNSQAGDVILIEQQVTGPIACPNDGTDRCTPNTNACDIQYGLVPVEWNTNEFNAIQMVTATGRVVVEAAGNGEQNLDAAAFLNLFKRSTRDSGAILVGGGNSASHQPACFSNYGSRLDVQAWSDSVRTLGYNDIQVNGSDQKQWYATGFGGTSAASAIIAGVASDVQSACKAGNVQTICTTAGQTLPPYGSAPGSFGMRELLTFASTPQPTPVSAQIGPIPNLRFALSVREPPAKGGVAAVKWTSTKNAVFAVDQAGSLELRSKNGSNAWTAAAPVAGGSSRFPAGAPIAVGFPVSTELRVFSVSSSGQLFFTRSTSGAAFTTMTAIGNTGVAPAFANLATGIRNSNQLHVFFVDSSSRLMAFFATGTGTTWTGPVLIANNFAPPGAPLATGRQSTNQLDVFGIGSDGTLKAAFATDGGSWNTPVNLSASGAGTPWNPTDRSGGGVTTGRQGTDQLDVFFVGNGNGTYGILQAAWVVGLGFWNGPVGLHSTSTFAAGSQLSTVQHGSGNTTLDVFAKTQPDATTNLSSLSFMRVVGTGAWSGPTVVSQVSGHGADSAFSAAANRSTNLADVVMIGTNGLGLATATNGGSYTTFATFP